MFKKKRFLSKSACILLCLMLVTPDAALVSHAMELPDAETEVVQTEENSESDEKDQPSDEMNNEASEEVTDDSSDTSEEVTDDSEEISEEVTDESEETSEEMQDEASEEVKEDAEEDEESEKPDLKNLPEIKGDYYRQYMATLFAEDQIECSDETASLSVDEATKKLVVAGTKDELMAGEFSVAKTFNFDGGCVDRFAFEASAAKGQKVTLGFYLDDSEEPFVTKLLVKQRKKNTWEYGKDYTVDISGMKLTGEHTLKIKVIDASDSKPSFSLNWVEFVESSVPVIYFNIDESEGTISEMNTSDDHSVECYGSMTVKVPDGYKSVDTGKALTGGEYNLEYIRGRGNSTWGTGKNPYKIKLEESSKLLGMAKNKHWVLLANYYDNSLLRNRITYWIGKKLGMAYTPSMEPVDVVMNGEYYGSYFLCEHIRVDKNRVNIKDLEKTPDATDEADITGGYLLSMWPYGDEPTKKTIRTEKGIEYLVESPEFDGYENEAQVNYITNYLQTIEDALYSSDFNTKDGVRYSELMDLKSTALYYWLQEFSMNGDAYGSGSTYLYKPENDKLYWGPLWDFDYVAWGSTEYEEFNTNGWSQNGDEAYMANWNGRLFEDPEFAKEVYSAWDELRPILQELTATGGQIDKYEADMDITARYNFEKLGATDLGQEDGVDLTYHEEIIRLKSWVDQRFNWVDKNVSSIEPVVTTITFQDEKGNVIETRTGLVGRTLGKLPEAPKKKGKTFIGWTYKVVMTLETFMGYYGCSTEEELLRVLMGEGFSEEEAKDLVSMYAEPIEYMEMVDTYTQIIENMVLTPYYMDDSEIVRPKKIYLDKKVYTGVYLDEEGSGYFVAPEYQVIPFDAYDSSVTFTTDDESVLRFDEYNEPEVMGTGECTLIAKSSSGLQATAKVKIYSEKEAEENGEIFDTPYLYVEKSAKVKKGSYYQLKFDTTNEVGAFRSHPYLFSSDESVVEVGSAGVIHAVRPGTAFVFCNSNDEISICKVTVPKTPGQVGTTVTKDGIKYKVTANTSKTRAVTCMGPSKKTIKKANIPSTITINKKKYKVTKIKGEAFKNCKSLTSVTIGKYVEVVGKSAFYGCKKLTSIRINASQPKIYSSSFKGVPKKAKFNVPVKAKNYFKIVLKGKTIVTHK